MYWNYAINGFVHVCGHRGHSLGTPENTIAALRANAAHGGTTAEIDTVLTADDQIVVIHDLSVDRTTNGTGAVRDMTLAEVRTLDAGAWFHTGFTGERVPTLTETIALAHEFDLGLEVEVKEVREIARYTRALAKVLADPDDAARVMMIGFDHVMLKGLKAAIPLIKTGGIIHARHGDPVHVAQSANLDELCIDLAVWHPDDARALHAAGIANRCHVYNPDKIARLAAVGLDPRPALREWLRAGLIDTLSGDDVAWVKALVDEAMA